ncbi:Polyketide synthase PksN [Legionella massiliensis]|uniref:Polyketide synthase PksN n=1 Tax=Legionella massiliensis TaxID=1034943 RepID=A0A078KXY6_9GAMM|nr:SDR family NAD(P)-dependent oxidoreductase [Legionella massiliensis]CDZ76614.1 Polyketide synthase PksN [Legionella massiliensis]CEE12352.1 Polyketide synthase PksN [Legionella massiliensis]
MFDSKKNVKNVADIVFINSEYNPEGIAYRFINTDGSTNCLNYQDFANEVTKLAYLIQEVTEPGDTVILGAKQGLEYIISFYACLYAGTVAVPVFPPVSKAMTERFIHILKDANPKLVICDKEIISKLTKGMTVNRFLPKSIKFAAGISEETASMLTYLKSQQIPLMASEERFSINAVKLEPLNQKNSKSNAFIQYTSGSTGNPKGVMVSHGNLLDNFNVIYNALRHHSQSHKFSWLPPYHDMGLIAGILEPFYGGFTSTLMSTIDFIAHPTKWLQYMSAYHCTSTGAPNFAFELCVKQADRLDLSQLDLSALEVIANGSEPINYNTVNRFYQTFQSSGLKRGAIFPCYGLAEATLMVTAKPIMEPEEIVSIDPEMLTKNIMQLTDDTNGVKIVSSGVPQMMLKIINEQTRLECPEGEVGEIWVHGESVAQGYYHNEEATELTFHNKINGDNKDYLYTGDLGFMYKNELFVCGRKKDLIIINGQNFYPQDLENQVTLSSDKIRQGNVIAYSELKDGQEQITLVCEIKDRESEENYRIIAEKIQQHLAKSFHFTANNIYFIPPKKIPKTTSGKLQRRSCAEKIAKNELTILYHGEFKQPILVRTQAIKPAKETWLNQLQEVKSEIRQSTLSTLLQNEVSHLLDVQNPKAIPLDRGLFELGFDSIKAIQLKEKIAQELGNDIDIDEDFLFNFPSIQVAASALISQLFPEITNRDNIKEFKPNSVASLTTQEPIAVIGMSCVFPGANDVNEFWDNLIQGRDSVTDIPAERFDINDYYSPIQGQKGGICTRKGGFIEGIDQFDAAFFNISPKEAELLDPQQRLLLKHTWLAFENANINVSDLVSSNTGVFIGISTHDYEHCIYENTDSKSISPYFSTGNATSTASGRLSFFYGFQGPCFAVDTACSSSLAAIDQACLSLQNKLCNLAVSGGVNAILSPELFISFSQAGMLAPDGKCKTFDANADGYVRGEGCGVVILKRLSDALRDKDHIIGVIKGSSVAHDGLSSGLTVPNGQAQQQLIRNALERSKIDATEIDYIECHGTGTSLGDPIEVNSIKKIFNNQRKQPLLLGSVKANIGHLEAAAGMAGFIKVLLCLQHRTIPPQINFNTLNPKIKINNNMQINTQLGTINPDKKFRAAVSSFGFSGTNAHIIMEEAPLQTKDSGLPLPPAHVFVLSAKTKFSLDSLIKAYQEFLAMTDASLADLCYTAAVGRAHLQWRIAVTATSKKELIEKLGQISPIDTMQSEEKPSEDDVLSVYLSGKDIDWKSYYASYLSRLSKVSLPTYRFEMQSHWLAIKKKKTLAYGEMVHELLGAKQPGHSDDLRFLNQLVLNDLDYLKDHRVFDHIIFPAAGFIETALASGVEALGDSPLRVKDISFQTPLALNGITDYEVNLEPRTNNSYQGSIYAKPKDALAWSHHADFELESLLNPGYEVIDLAAIKSTLAQVDMKTLYQRFKQVGLVYGDAFQAIQEAFTGHNKALVAIKNEQRSNNDYFHPALLDGVFQAVALALSEELNATYIPLAIGRLDWYQKASGLIWAEVTLINRDEHALNADIKITDNNGMLIAEIKGFVAYAVTKQALEKLLLAKKEALGRYVEHYELYNWSPALKANRDVLMVKDSSEEDLSNRHIVFVYENNFKTLVSLAKKLLVSKPLSFTLVTQQAFSVNAKDEINPDHSQALGFWRSLRQEANNIPCYLIDVKDKEPLDLVLNLIGTNSLPEPQVILRGQSVYVPHLINADEDSALAQSFQYQADATYLITGGTGGLGFELAKHLLAQGVKHLALTSRSEATTELRLWMEQQQSNGVSITHYATDVADKKALKEVFDAIAQSGFSLKGIFHAAGVLHDGLLLNLSEEDFDVVLTPKVQGAKNLDELSQALTLDCFVLFSSISSMLGNPGQSNYSAANAFMNGLAMKRRQQGLSALSINWGPFSTVGMAAGLEAVHKAQGLTALKTQPAFATMDELLSTPKALVGVMEIDWSKVVSPSNPYLAHFAPRVIPQTLNQGTWISLLAATPTERREQVLTDKIKGVLAKILNISKPDSLDIKKNFFELGMDSIMAMEFKNVLQTMLGSSITISNTLVFDNPNIENAVAYLLREIVTTESNPVIADASKTLEAKNIVDQKPLIRRQSFNRDYIYLEGGENAVLLFYGLNGSPLEVLDLAKNLNEAGYSVEIPLIEGYHYDVKKKIFNRSESWIRDALGIFYSMNSRYKSVALCGLSLGAVVALRLAELLQNKPSALLLLSTALFTDGWSTDWKRSLIPLVYYSPLRYRLSLPETEPFGIKNLERRAYSAKLMQEKSVSISGGAQISFYDIYQARRLAKVAVRNLSLVTCPTLIMHAKEDDIASLKNIEVIAGGISSSVVEQTILEDSYHMITVDNEKELVMEQCRDFLDKNTN